ncbi:salicylate carboxymethyltransferase-like [Rhodamnia argentea]|uniref:Salicylate carboxymethyltransferase-like n=1 Tax=Rhodamnia argentea TaxID=178133 RepID=A0ABM3GXQ8_9MYRT|nr:salicylate carboxymethyltransferase-like [Rhodamnia argentea]
MGGRMVLTLLGRRSDDPSSKECCSIWELLAITLNDMVSEGLIEEEKLDSFNIPQYTPSPKEVRLEVQKQGSFSIDCLEVFGVNWSEIDSDFDPNVVSEDGGYHLSRCIRAVAEPLVVHHFGEEIIDEVFKRYKAQLAAHMSTENPTFVNVVISLKKIA